MDDLSYVGKVEENLIGTQKLDWSFKQDQALQVKKKSGVESATHSGLKT